MQPNIVGEIRCTDIRVALAVRAVTGDAVGLEMRLARDRIATRRLAARERHHVRHGIVDTTITEDLGPWRHDAHATARDRCLNEFRRAAPQPVGVGEVGEAGCAAAVGTVAGGAVVSEQVATDTHGVRIRGKLTRIAIREARENALRLALLSRLHLFPLFDLGPAERSRVIAKSRVKHGVPHRERHREQEQPQPPPGQRVVEFLEITIPDMSGRVGGTCRLATALAHPEQ